MRPRPSPHRRLALAGLLACVLLPAIAQAQGTVPATAVRFAQGATSATVNGQLKGLVTDARDYVVRAQGGQTLGVRLQTSSKDTYFVILQPPYGDRLYANEGDLRSSWSGQLVEAGDYRVRVYLTPEAARAAKGAAFTLAIDLK